MHQGDWPVPERDELPITRPGHVMDLVVTHASNGITFTDIDRQRLYQIRYQPAPTSNPHRWTGSVNAIERIALFPVECPSFHVLGSVSSGRWSRCTDERSPGCEPRHSAHHDHQPFRRQGEEGLTWTRHQSPRRLDTPTW
jgi:hypothetical protein